MNDADAVAADGADRNPETAPTASARPGPGDPPDEGSDPVDPVARSAPARLARAAVTDGVGRAGETSGWPSWRCSRSSP